MAPSAARAAIEDRTGAAISSGHLAVADWRMAVVFRYDSDRCTDADTPDAPARAFRDARGRMHLFATHDDNRVLIGADFDHLHHPCRIVFRGRHSAVPGDFSNRAWLTAFSTDDGRHLVALVHDEFQGNLRKDGQFYVMFHAEALPLQAAGTGVARSGRPEVPTSWRRWDGAGFNAGTPPRTYARRWGRAVCSISDH